MLLNCQVMLLAELASLGLAAGPDRLTPVQLQWEHLAQVRSRGWLNAICCC
jgi:hypothetical protein